MTHARLLGARLRHVRQQQNLSLHDVEARSDGELKASVVGAYERGERMISMIRLHRMASFFRVPVTELLPEVSRVDISPEPSPDLASDRIVIDLVALEERSPNEPVLTRYVDAITARRGDFNGRVLTVRAADLDTLAAVMDTRPDELRAWLLAEGLVRGPR
ncbi:MAG: transcriptional regulator [Intrasporangiaceae bacterium]|nr:transcriptional regulator [Intrasporangiaceae bacterium]